MATAWGKKRRNIRGCEIQIMIWANAGPIRLRDGLCVCPPVCGRQAATAVPLVRTWKFVSQGKYLSRRWNFSDIFRSCSPSFISVSPHLLPWHFHIQISQEQWCTCLIEASRTYASSHRLVRPTREADETKGPTSHCGKLSQSLNQCSRNGCWGSCFSFKATDVCHHCIILFIRVMTFKQFGYLFILDNWSYPQPLFHFPT